jgi:HAD superfamily hydrolase (TIGR01459 family)
MTRFPILEGAGTLLARYDVIISDVWGVVHDGLWALEPACAALAAFRAEGGSVVLLSNAPGPSEQIARLLDKKRVPRAAWDRLVTSGDVTRALLVADGHRQVFHIGTARDTIVFKGTDAVLVDEDGAEVVVATELRDDRSESPEDYRPLLARLAARGLPFICGNPDLVVHVGADLLPCAGALATIYEELGGTVKWAGKPHRPAYDLALAAANEARNGRAFDMSRVLVIGDAVRTDLAGAALIGADALFIAGGIHRDEVMIGGVLDQTAVDDVLAATKARVVGVLAQLTP